MRKSAPKITRNATERKKVKEALRQSEEHLKLLIESVQDYAIFMLDPEGYIRTWNIGAQRIKGYTADEIIGSHFSRFYPKEDQKKPEMELRHAAGQGVYKEEGWRIRKDGSRFWAYVVITAIKDKSGDLIGFAKVTRDMTEKKKVEETLQKTNEDLERRVQERTKELQQYSEELARSNADLQQFAYIASHDLQEPLRMVSLYIDVLERQLKNVMDPKAAQYFQFLRDGCVRAQRLIRELLEYSRIGTKDAPFSMINMEEVLQHVLSLLELSIKENRAVITHDPLPEITADRFQMEQLIQNLISNSIKYRGKEHPKIHISAKKQEKEWVFKMTDNGIGIDPQYKEVIFTIFKRLHSTEDYPGTGIGLALCKKIVEQHGGKIWLESALGKGSTFFFTVPLHAQV